MRQSGFKRFARIVATALPAGAIPAMLSTTLAFGEGLPKLEWKTSDGGTVRIYGQIDQGVLYYDDGYQSKTYAPVDNNAESTRAGIIYTNTFVDSTFEAILEAEYRVYSSNNIS